MRNSQSGSALAIALVILTAITLIAMTSLQRSGLQSKIVTNIQHQEQLFNCSSDDQEYWFDEFRDSLSGDNLLSAPLLAYTQGEDGSLTYSKVTLVDPATNGNRQQHPFINCESDVIYNPPKEGGIALASGHETDTRITFHFTLDSNASQNNGNKLNSQQSGLEFPGLNAARSRTQ